MNVEQRLVEVFQTSARIEPTPDLFSRVVHSIEEDRRHRRRVLRTTVLLAASFLAMVVVGGLSIEGGQLARHVHRPTMEILEVVALTLLLVVLGPAIRRFGRNYAADLWPADAATPRLMLRLLDVAFYLVGAGYILLSTELRFGSFDGFLADQLGDASIRIGGLLLALGVLHATTLFVLPLVAFVDNATRTGKSLPRWILLLLVLIGLGLVPFLQVAVGIGMRG
jgi:hypothetical protein